MQDRVIRPFSRLSVRGYLFRIGFCALVSAASVIQWSIPAYAQNTSHVVQEGETLSEIAELAGTDVETLLALNGLADADSIQAGQVLILPGPAETEAPTAGALTHVVQDGETLADIAFQWGVDPTALAEANGLDDADILYAGTTLVIPVDVAAPPASDDEQEWVEELDPAQEWVEADGPSSSGTSSGPTRGYLVQPGDTLAGIADQFGASVDALMASNGLSEGAELTAGVTIQVPIPTREWTVQPGETLADIAASEQIDLGTLTDLNGITDPDLVTVGQVLLLPTGGSRPVVAAAVPSSEPEPAPLPDDPADESSDDEAHAASEDGDNDNSEDAESDDNDNSGGGDDNDNDDHAVRPEVQVKAVSGDLAATAESLIGSPYVWGATGPYEFDCSGFIYYVAQQADMGVGRGMQQQYDAGRHPKRRRLVRGDVVFFQNTYTDGLSHNGIYLGDGRFIHAADEASGVTISELNDEFWSAHWYGATRFGSDDG